MICSEGCGLPNPSQPCMRAASGGELAAALQVRPACSPAPPRSITGASLPLATMFEARLAQGALLKKASLGRCQLRRLMGAIAVVAASGGQPWAPGPAPATPLASAAAPFKRAPLARCRPPAQVVEAIKDLIEDANFDCNNSGFSLQAMDSSHVSLVALSLRADGFEHYRCDRNISMGALGEPGRPLLLRPLHSLPTTLPLPLHPPAPGMKLANLSKILKCAGNDDAITMKSEDNGDTITFMFESPSERSASVRLPPSLRSGRRVGRWFHACLQHAATFGRRNADRSAAATLLPGRRAVPCMQHSSALLHPAPAADQERLSEFDLKLMDIDRWAQPGGQARDEQHKQRCTCRQHGLHTSRASASACRRPCTPQRTRLDASLHTCSSVCKPLQRAPGHPRGRVRRHREAALQRVPADSQGPGVHRRHRWVPGCITRIG